MQDRQSFKEELTDIIPRLLQNLVTKADILSLCTIDPESRNVIHNIVLKLEEYPVSMQEALLKVVSLKYLRHIFQTLFSALCSCDYK